MSPEKRAFKRMVLFVLGAMSIGVVLGLMTMFMTPMLLTGILLAVALTYAMIILYEVLLSQEKEKDTLK